MVYPLKITKTNLQNFCLYASIAHAISLLKYPEFDYEQSWDGVNYSQVNGQGARGTISFSEKIVVGAFRNENLHQSYKPADNYLVGADEKFKKLAEDETFLYLLDDVSLYVPKKIKTDIKPVITTAFWGDNDGIFSNDSIEDFKLRSDGLLDFVFLDIKSQREYWKETYEFTQDEIDLVDSIFEIKQSNSGVKIELFNFQKYLTKVYEDEGISACQESLSEI
ncbi:MAG: hypothetical protein LBI13_05540 [Streptococcaceae bacterium]|jgi:hypothetical protein|nr:hypothetical protein [Streptococcaceae bacterium]